MDSTEDRRFEDGELVRYTKDFFDTAKSLGFYDDVAIVLDGRVNLLHSIKLYWMRRGATTEIVVEKSKSPPVFEIVK